MSPMMIHKITPSVTHNLWLKRLDTENNKQSNKDLMKVPKVIDQTNEKMLL